MVRQGSSMGYWVVLGLVPGFVACGGQVTKDPGGGSAGQSSEADQLDEEESEDWSRALGECQGSIEATPETPCEWQDEQGRCYETMDRACDCLCPRKGHSQCIFDGNRRVIYCVALESD